MKRLGLFILVPVVFCGIFASSPDSSVEKQLQGKWEYCECWPGADLLNQDCVFYSIDIQKENNKFILLIDVDGKQSLTRVKAEGIFRSGILKVFFLENRDGHGWPSYKKGDLLFELIYKNDQIITNWVSMMPSIEEHKKADVYFIKHQIKHQNQTQ